MRFRYPLAGPRLVGLPTVRSGWDTVCILGTCRRRVDGSFIHGRTSRGSSLVRTFVWFIDICGRLFGQDSFAAKFAVVPAAFVFVQQRRLGSVEVPRSPGRLSIVRILVRMMFLHDPAIGATNFLVVRVVCDPQNFVEGSYCHRTNECVTELNRFDLNKRRPILHDGIETGDLVKLIVPVALQLKVVIKLDKFGDIFATVTTAGQDPVKLADVKDRAITLGQFGTDCPRLNRVITDGIIHLGPVKTSRAERCGLAICYGVYLEVICLTDSIEIEKNLLPFGRNQTLRAAWLVRISEVRLGDEVRILVVGLIRLGCRMGMLDSSAAEWAEKPGYHPGFSGHLSRIETQCQSY